MPLTMASTGSAPRTPVRLSRVARTILLSTVFLVDAPLFAQDTAVGIIPRIPNHSLTGPPANIRVDANMVLIPVTVTDLFDDPVTGLSEKSFRVFEDKIEQKVLSFSQQDGPASVGFILDTSRSMRSRIGYSLAAIDHWLATGTNGDEAFVIRFSARPTILTSFTEDPTTISRALSSIQCEGWTALNDAIYLGLNEMKRARNPRRALVVLTDGEDNFSRYSDTEVARLARESEVRIYSIGLFARVGFLEKLGDESGGKALWVRMAGDVPVIIDKLNRIFRNQYVLGYVPANHTNDGKYRHLTVKLTGGTGRDQLRVTWREGYYSGW
jgi:Ca-activated chloride channel homolog